MNILMKNELPYQTYKHHYLGQKKQNMYHDLIQGFCKFAEIFYGYGREQYSTR